MGKTRMSALDLKASVAEMATLVGLRLNNVYDISPREFLFKFGHGDRKAVVLVESGIRMHITTLEREKPKVPSQFTFKMRKHIRSWRLESITQVNTDRLIVMKFGGDTASFHIIVELFAAGNVVLTDQDYKILMLQRSHKEGDVKCAVGAIYALPSPTCGPHAELVSDRWALQAHLAAVFKKVLLEAPAQESLRNIISRLENFGQALADHALATVELHGNVNKQHLSSDDGLLEKLMPGLISAFHTLYGAVQPGGFLFRREVESKRPAVSQGPDADVPPAEVGSAPEPALTALQLRAVQYDDFSPVILQQYRTPSANITSVSRKSFGDVVDTYFLYFEANRIDQHNEKKQSTTVSKREKCEQTHRQRIQHLQNQEDLNRQRGELMLKNVEIIQQAIDLMNGVLAQKLPWGTIQTLLKRRQAEGHAVAAVIHEVHFDRNSITVLLEDDLLDEEDETEMEPMAVEVNLDKSAFENVTKYYALKKAQHAKLEKTVAATDKALAGAEKKGARQSAKLGTAKKEILVQRKTQWWEKFIWFITTAGHLVVSGRDNQQTDMLVNKYMKTGDIFVYSDAPKAFPCIVKGHDPCLSIPLLTIQEAGAMCVCRSQAWDNKSSVSAWWVYPSQINKCGAGSGCHTSPGLYGAVDGDRNYLKAMPLSLGVALMFRVQQKREPHIPEDGEEMVPPDTDPVRTSSNEMEEPSTPLSSDLLPPGSFGSKSSKTRHANLSSRLLKEKLALVPPQATNDSSEDSRSRSSHSSAAAQAAANRRAQRKAKKIKKKYAEQDEDDVQIRMQLLGNPIANIHQDLLRARAAKETAREDAASQQRAHQRVRSSNTISPPAEETGDLDSSGEDDVDVENVGAAGKRSVRFAVLDSSEVSHEASPFDESPADSPAAQQKVHMAELAALRASAEHEECAKISEMIRREAVDDLPYFTGMPTVDDVVLYAVSVCAPRCALTRYKYSVELSHGNEKKGNATKEILQHFHQVAQLHQQHHLANSVEVAATERVDPQQLTHQLAPSVRLRIPSIAMVAAGLKKAQQLTQHAGSTEGGSKPQRTAEAPRHGRRHADPREDEMLGTPRSSTSSTHTPKSLLVH